MLGSGLVEYESSDDGEEAEPEGAEATQSDRTRVTVTEKAAGHSLKRGAEATPVFSSDSDEADSDDSGGDGDALSAMAAADDAVEESLRMRVPASAAAEAAKRTSDLHSLPSSPPLQQQQLQGQVQQKPSSSAATKKQQLLEKRRRILLLGAAGAAAAATSTTPGTAAEADSSDEDDEDAVKRRRVVAAAAADSGRLRGASSLLARLPRPKALAVREGGARLLAAPAAAAASARPPPPLAASSLATAPKTALTAAEESAHYYDADDVDQKQALLSAILPQRELHRYRQATGASLTAEAAGGSGSGGILDIRQSDQLAGAELQMAKELTRNADADPRRKPAGPLPGSMAKRKHQITYLAYQAQEREIELKNSWADARFNQRSSQNKYGF